MAKNVGVAKLITLIVVCIIVIFGILGSFKFMDFDMGNYTMFLDKFALILSVLIGSVGVGSTAKKILENFEKQKNNTPS